MKYLYIYPKLDLAKLKSSNPYIDNLEKSLKKEFIISNNSFNTKGVLDFYQHLFSSDAFLINWIEYLPNQRLGKIQFIAFILFVKIARHLFKKKIIWVLHNWYSHTKLAHSDGVSLSKKYLFEFMIKNSNLILTHSQNGIYFVKEKFQKQAHKVHYIIHPIAKIYTYEKKEFDYDLMLWGTIHPYKGVIEFLDYASKAGYLVKTRILIAGLCPDEQLKKRIDYYVGSKLVHINRFLDFEEIRAFIQKSRFVLFTYNSDSVLSSGSLMDTISMGGRIIGPKRGAFLDLSNHSFMSVFTELQDIFRILEESEASYTEDYLKEMTEFCIENSWDSFSTKFKGILQSIGL